MEKTKTHSFNLIPKIICFIYYLFYFIFFVGFLFYESNIPFFLVYSLKYWIFLIVIASGFLLPVVISKLSIRYGKKTIMFSCLPMMILFTLVYIVSSQRYYYTQNHPFDPFLQIAPPDVSSKFINQNSDENDIVRILTVGGSTTANLRLNNNERYPSVLQDLLTAQYPNKKIDVINAGMDWYTSKHSLINYVTNLSELKPDFVIVMHAINDLYRSFSDSNYSNGPYNRAWSHFYGPSVNGMKPPAFEEYLLNRFWPKKIWFSKIRTVESDYPMDKYLSHEDFIRYMDYIIKRVKDDGGIPILMTQPALYKNFMTSEEQNVLWFANSFCKEKSNFFQSVQPSYQSLYRAHSVFNQSTRELAIENETLLIDLEKVIEKDLVNFSDDVHYTVAGSKNVAIEVATFLEDHLFDSQIQ